VRCGFFFLGFSLIFFFNTRAHNLARVRARTHTHTCTCTHTHTHKHTHTHTTQSGRCHGPAHEARGIICVRVFFFVCVFACECACVCALVCLSLSLSQSLSLSLSLCNGRRHGFDMEEKDTASKGRVHIPDRVHQGHIPTRSLLTHTRSLLTR